MELTHPNVSRLPPPPLWPTHAPVQPHLSPCSWSAQGNWGEPAASAGGGLGRAALLSQPRVTAARWTGKQEAGAARPSCGVTGRGRRRGLKGQELSLAGSFLSSASSTAPPLPAAVTRTEQTGPSQRTAQGSPLPLHLARRGSDTRPRAPAGQGHGTCSTSHSAPWPCQCLPALVHLAGHRPHTLGQEHPL